MVACYSTFSTVMFESVQLPTPQMVLVWYKYIQFVFLPVMWV